MAAVAARSCCLRVKGCRQTWLGPGLDDGLDAGGAALPASQPADRPTLAELKRRYIAQVLEESRGNVSRAAAVLGVDRRSLYRMLQRYGLARAGSRE